MCLPFCWFAVFLTGASGFFHGVISLGSYWIWFRVWFFCGLSFCCSGWFSEGVFFFTINLGGFKRGLRFKMAWFLPNNGFGGGLVSIWFMVGPGVAGFLNGFGSSIPLLLFWASSLVLWGVVYSWFLLVGFVVL